MDCLKKSSLIDLRNGSSFLASGVRLLAFSECRKNRFNRLPVAKDVLTIKPAGCMNCAITVILYTHEYKE